MNALNSEKNREKFKNYDDLYKYTRWKVSYELPGFKYCGSCLVSWHCVGGYFTRIPHEADKLKRLEDNALFSV